MQAVFLQIAKRFRQSKQQDSFISFVSSSSTSGIALGCAVLILLLSVMNGFEHELRVSLLKVVPHAEIFAIDNKGLYPDPTFVKQIENDPKVKKVFSINKAAGLLQKGKKMKAVSALIGVEDEYLQAKFGNPMYAEKLATMENAILLGDQIMQNLELEVGDKIQLLLPSNTQDLSFKAPKSAWVVIQGSVNVGGELDNQIGLLNKQYLAALLGFDQQTTHIEISLYDPFNAFELVRQYGFQFNQAAYMSDWTRTHGHLYQDIQLIRTVVYIVLALVIAVASFNIVSALVMSVKEKSREIAILKTLGASNTNIASIFVVKGLYHGVSGAFIGTTIGVLLALFLGDIIRFFESIFNTELLSGDIYFTGTIPSQLEWLDVLMTVLIVLSITTLATLYPAYKAAKLDPATNLS
ncbi:lipoprotein-releasing ABC transporter permease subunit [Glaciecola petra]|uniref:Lipoprotein-releasing ABC transporter permease subunit n=1 Tax=Glaciecola petra TaxID=3075602 RepID=A0ABU2ZNM2_9ALTE|nr:lipoprotein-releasing ABC transporter permease subunit [Aestuariibacter sp. P117]MDT0594205.1 lipoprotein-releasing ABC transporter permease subunit [Aestuariibacter sp. P117]